MRKPVLLLVSSLLVACDASKDSYVGYRFAAGTSVATPSGPRPIETLRIGELALGFDLERDRVVARPVTATHARLAPHAVKLTVADRSLVVTPGHPFWTGDRSRIDVQGDHTSSLTIQENDDTVIFFSGAR